MSSAMSRRLAASPSASRWLVPVVVVASLAAFSSPARADQPAPERDACNAKKAGDVCDVPGGGQGTCAEETCYELDYSQGSPPKSVPVACLVCKAGAGGSSDSNGGTGTAPDGLGGSQDDGGAASGGDDAVPETKSKCSVDERGGEGPWWLLALAGVWFARRRR